MIRVIPFRRAKIRPKQGSWGGSMNARDRAGGISVKYAGAAPGVVNKDSVGNEMPRPLGGDGRGNSEQGHRAVQTRCLHPYRRSNMIGKRQRDAKCVIEFGEQTCFYSLRDLLASCEVSRAR